MRTRSLKRQQGAEIVEFIVTLPVILLLFALFVDFGLAIADKAVITDASRAAAREFIRSADQNQAYAAADAVLASTIRWGSSSAYSCGGGSNCSITSATTNPGDPVTVTVTLPFQSRFLPGFFELLGRGRLFEDINLAGTTVMRMMPTP